MGECAELAPDFESASGHSIMKGTGCAGSRGVREGDGQGGRGTTA